MHEKTEYLPYFKTQNLKVEKEVFRFLKRKFKPSLEKEINQHYLIQPLVQKKLEYIKKEAKGFPYFLKFDIKTYYPSINNEVLLRKVEGNYKNITKRKPSRRFKRYLENEISIFLLKSPLKRGLSIGSPLSYLLAGLYLLELDFKIKNPFLRMVDDYIIFFKKKKEPEIFLKNILIPTLKSLELEINEKKLKSGKTNVQKFTFIGFDYYSGYFTISQEKKFLFKKRITHLTRLTRKKSQKQILKELNNKILGFGHYYKHCSCKKDFEDLDAFVRMRTRRYFSRTKDSKNKGYNLKITNEFLKFKGLKSLRDIKEEYDEKKKGIFSKKRKMNEKSCKEEKTFLNKEIHIKELYYNQKKILEELKSISSFLKRLEKKEGVKKKK